ncbi:MAG: SH3 domain-containing protein [Thermomonas sp.]
MPGLRTLLASLLFALSLAPGPAFAGDALPISPAQLDATYWIAKLPDAERVVLDRNAIAARNASLPRIEPSWHDLAALPASLDRDAVYAQAGALSAMPTRTLYAEDGHALAANELASLQQSLALDAIPPRVSVRYALVLQRAPLRTFPTVQRVFSKPGDVDIDRFQESALFPGTPVAVLHASRDGRWRFVVASNYAAWIRADALAEGSRDEVLGYAMQQPQLVITGDNVRTVFDPSRPQLSQLPLDMGTHLPLLADWPRDAAVSGQVAYAAWVVRLPMRDANGQLQLVPALIPRGSDARVGDLPLSRANLLRQAFKLLGERYGWGHDYDGRDCSGFLSDVFATFGVRMPRNTGDQAKSPAFAHERFDESASRETRMRAISTLQVGDLVYIPGHVLMVVGFERGEPWVIHDVQGVSIPGADGALRRIPLNGVSVTPLLPLRFDAGHDYVDRMTAIVHPLAPLPAGAH